MYLWIENQAILSLWFDRMRIRYVGNYVPRYCGCLNLNNRTRILTLKAIKHAETTEYTWTKQ